MRYSFFNSNTDNNDSTQSSPDKENPCSRGKEKIPVNIDRKQSLKLQIENMAYYLFQLIKTDESKIFFDLALYIKNFFEKFNITIDKWAENNKNIEKEVKNKRSKRSKIKKEKKIPCDDVFVDLNDGVGEAKEVKRLSKNTVKKAKPNDINTKNKEYDSGSEEDSEEGEEVIKKHFTRRKRIRTPDKSKPNVLSTNNVINLIKEKKRKTVA